MGVQVNEEGIVQDGPWKGYKLDDVLEFAQNASVAQQETPPASTPPGNTTPATPPAQPRNTLAEGAAVRVDRVAGLLAIQRIEEDERAFAATVPDYDAAVPGIDPPKTYRQVIAESKKTVALEYQMQPGFHQKAYLLIKSDKDPAFRSRALGIEPPAAPQETPPAGEVPPAAASTPPAPATPTPRAVPPAVSAPTPGARAAAPTGERKPKLVATDKVKKYCKAFGKDVDAYLMEVEDRGLTQSDLDRFAVGAGPTRPQGRKSVFDHSDD